MHKIATTTMNMLKVNNLSKITSHTLREFNTCQFNTAKKVLNLQLVSNLGGNIKSSIFLQGSHYLPGYKLIKQGWIGEKFGPGILSSQQPIVYVWGGARDFEGFNFSCVTLKQRYSGNTTVMMTLNSKGAITKSWRSWQNWFSSRPDIIKQMVLKK